MHDLASAVMILTFRAKFNEAHHRIKIVKIDLLLSSDLLAAY